MVGHPGCTLEEAHAANDFVRSGDRAVGMGGEDMLILVLRESYGCTGIQTPERLGHCETNTVLDEPRSLVAAADQRVQPVRGESVRRVEEELNGEKPLRGRCVRVVEDGAGSDAKLKPAVTTLVLRPCPQVAHSRRRTPRAADTVRPSNLLEVGAATLVRRMGVGEPAPRNQPTVLPSG